MGLFISIQPRGRLPVLTVQPANGRKVIFENLPKTLNWAQKYLHKLPDSEADCRAYFQKIYDQVPSNTDFYFLIQEYISRLTDKVVKKECKVLGPGVSARDALSTHLLFPAISSAPDPLITLSGSFT